MSHLQHSINTFYSSIEKEPLDDNKWAPAEVCKHDYSKLVSGVSHFCSFELSNNLMITISVLIQYSIYQQNII